MSFHEAFDPFRSLGAAWRLLIRAPLTLLVGGLLFVFLDPSNGPAGMEWTEDRRDLVPAMLLATGMFGCFAIVLWLFRCLLLVGLPNAVEKVIRTGESDIGVVFDARGQWFAMVVTTFLVAAINWLALAPGILIGVATGWFCAENLDPEWGALLGFVPFVLWLPVWCWVHLGLDFARRAVALEGLRPVQAIERSIALARGHRLRYFFYKVVMFVVAMIGLLACCCGVLFTAALAEIAYNESYVRLVRQPDAAGWWADQPDRP